MAQQIMNCSLLTVLFLSSNLTAAADSPAAFSEDSQLLEVIKVTSQRVANLQPASTYASLVTALRYDPQIDIQSRGLAEGQADVAVRGGLFENTGFKLGAVTVFDPQTGHYSVELPVDPVMLSAPTLLTGSANSIYAFNASVATLDYGYADILSGGNARLAVGSDNLRFASARVSHNDTLSSGRSAGLTLAAAASEGDGTQLYGDHQFKRFAGHFQLGGKDSQTNLIIGYQDKFTGWPGMYTGFASLPETDQIKQGLVVLDHRQENADGWWQVASAYRWLDDDYDFDRRTVDTGGPGSFEHKTRSFSLGINGVRLGTSVDWNYSAMIAADRLVSSTDLTGGDFDSRSYLSMALAPEWVRVLESGAQLQVQAGLRADISNRDADALMPLGSITWTRALSTGSQSLGLDLSRTSQLPGYTALKSPPSGLFGGNPDLGREFANTASLSYIQEYGKWYSKSAFFFRRDEDLVDWTYSSDAPFSRQANAVNLDVYGVELMLEWASEQWNVMAGYVFMDKDADYGTASVDASFYALNYARHRATLALSYSFTQNLVVSMDNEFRNQEKNPLRDGNDNAWFTSVSASWQIPAVTGLGLALVADNLTDEDFQEFPGTPAYGRQVSLALGLDW